MKILSPCLMLTGFEPFLDVKLNPSGEIARALDGRLIAGTTVHSAILPVAYRSLGPSYARALEELEPSLPIALLSLGVHREGFFRLETRARPVLDSEQPDSEGRRAAQIDPLGDRELFTSLDLDALAQALRSGGANEIRVSDNAGGYLCERCYYEVLATGDRLGVPGFFLHVPPVGLIPLEDQFAPVTAFIEELVRQASS